MRLNSARGYMFQKFKTWWKQHFCGHRNLTTSWGSLRLLEQMVRGEITREQYSLRSIDAVTRYECMNCKKKWTE